MELRIDEIIKAARCSVEKKGREVKISSVSTDTRNLSSGAIFFALKGDRFDGHNFLKQAIKKRAHALVVSRPFRTTKPIWVLKVPDTLKALGEVAGYYRRKFEITTIGITGTCGKTSTKEILHNILSRQAKVLSNVGNYNNLIGLPLTVFRLKRHHEFCILEMGANRRGEIKILSEIGLPQIGLVTHIGRAHLEFFGSLRGVLSAKMELVEGLPQGGVVVANGDIDMLRRAITRKRVKKIFFGFNKGNHFRAEKINFLNGKTAFKTAFSTKGRKFLIDGLGKGNVYNSLAAIACARYLNVSWERIEEGISNFKKLAGRLQILKKGYKIIINDAYNANPDSVLEAFEVVSAFKTKRKILVFSDMLELGKKSISFHKEIGRILKDRFSLVFAFGELAKLASEEAVRCGMPAQNIFCFKKKGNLLKRLEETVESKDIILFKGSHATGLDEVAERFIDRSA